MDGRLTTFWNGNIYNVLRGFDVLSQQDRDWKGKIETNCSFSLSAVLVPLHILSLYFEKSFLVLIFKNILLFLNLFNQNLSKSILVDLCLVLST